MIIDMMTLCDYAQESNGKLTIVGTFNKLMGSHLPAQYNMHLVARIGFEGDETKKKFQLLITIKKEGKDEPLIELPAELNNTGDGNFMYTNLNIDLSALPFPEEGKYSIKLHVGDIEQEIPLFVSLKKE